MSQFREEQKKLQEHKDFAVGSEPICCPHCSAENEPEAKYCSECGELLQLGGKCSSCGAVVLPGADICEACGEWLLQGQCKFCYAPLEEDAKFCPECGNPVEGIVCPKCGKLNYFDFCKHCGIALTPQAFKMINELQNSEEFRILLEQLSVELISVEKRGQDEELQILKELKQFGERFKPPKKTEVQQNKRLTFEKMDEIFQRAQEVQKPHQEKSSMPSALEKLWQRKFNTNQEARRFFGALKVLLPTITITKIKRPIGWLCNIAGVLHPGGPGECGVAYGGGQWIFEEKEETKVEIKEFEI